MIANLREKIGKTVQLSKSQIQGIVTVCPKNKIVNSDFSDCFSEETIKNFEKMAGVSERYWADDSQSVVELSVKSVSELLDGLGWQASEVDALILVSQSPDHILPASSIEIAHLVKMHEGIIAYDVNLGCSGYPYGLFLAQSLIELGMADKVVLVASELPSRIIDRHDKSTAMLFGDAASATALARVENNTSSFILGSDGSGVNNLIIPNSRFSTNKLSGDSRLQGKNHDYLFMDGAEIFNFTITHVPYLVNRSIEIANIAPEYFLFHQANYFMLNHLNKKMKIPPNQILSNIKRFGNTSVASIPILLTESLPAQLDKKRETPVGMYGFGVGYSWSACVTSLPRSIYLKHTYA